MQSIMAVVNDLIRVSTALWRRQTRVSAVPISFDAPEMVRREQINILVPQAAPAIVIVPGTFDSVSENNPNRLVSPQDASLHLIKARRAERRSKTLPRKRERDGFEY